MKEMTNHLPSFFTCCLHNHRVLSIPEQTIRHFKSQGLHYGIVHSRPLTYSVRLGFNHNIWVFLAAMERTAQHVPMSKNMQVALGKLMSAHLEMPSAEFDSTTSHAEVCTKFGIRLKRQIGIMPAFQRLKWRCRERIEGLLGCSLAKWSVEPIDNQSCCTAGWIG